MKNVPIAIGIEYCGTWVVINNATERVSLRVTPSLAAKRQAMALY